MNRPKLSTAVIVVAVLGIAAPAMADHKPRWGFQIGIGSRGAHVEFGVGRGRRHVRHYDHGPRYRRVRHVRHRHRPVYERHCHRHVRRPHYKRVWVAPVYRTVFVGYDDCGRPVYSKIVVRRGYHRRVIDYYDCGSCGVRLR